MTKQPQQIEGAIKEYLGHEKLRGQSDVLQFNERVFKKVRSDPIATLTGFGSILESSLFEIIKEKWEQRTKERNERKAGLGTYISFIEKPPPHVNEDIIVRLNALNACRNEYVHQRKNYGSPDQDLSYAQECAIKILHYLVWKYECWAADEADREPRSVRDPRLMPWGAEVALEVSGNFRERAVSRSQVLEVQALDVWGTASIKSRIHAIAEAVAEEAAMTADLAVKTYPYAAFTMLIPLIHQLRWRRGYMSALRQILQVPEALKRLGDFTLEDVSPPCPVTGGILKAERADSDRVLVKLDDYPALYITGLSAEEVDQVRDGVNDYGRLGIPRDAAMTLQQRIGEIEIHAEAASRDEMAKCLFRNRYALVPLIARLGLPGSDWLLPGFSAIANRRLTSESRYVDGSPQRILIDEGNVKEEIFTATGAVQPQAIHDTSKVAQLEEVIEKFKTLYAEEENSEVALRRVLQHLRLGEEVEDHIIAMFKAWSLMEDDPEKIIRAIWLISGGL